MGEEGVVIAGRGHRRSIDVADRLVDRYGGEASDWMKMSSSSYTGADGLKQQTHWYESAATGERVEFKTKLEWTSSAPLQ